MKKKSIARFAIYAALIGILAFVLIPSTGSLGYTDWQLLAKTKLRSLNVLYATYTTSGARMRPLNSIEELKELALSSGGDLSMFSTYDPLNKRETPVLYFKPQRSDLDELVFVFREPILRREKSEYTKDDLNGLRYIASYTRSGIVSLESKPPELNQSEPGAGGNG